MPALAFPSLAAIDAELSRRSLRSFVENAWPIVEPGVPFVSNWHIDAICDHLEAVSAGTITRLLINIPPGCAKSLLVSVFWPAWEWLHWPSLRYLTASYNDRLTIRDTRKVRDILQSSWHRENFSPAIELRSDQNQKTKIETVAGGWRIATSVGGHGTGEHPDRVIVDDPHNPKQAESDTTRRAALDWFDRTISTRGVTRGARMVVIMQRLHQEDLSGHLLKRDGWTHLCLPMRFEPERMPVTPIGWRDPRTTPGDLLWPSLFTTERLAQLEPTLGSYGVAGQMQQRPVPAGGAIFKREWFTIVDAPPAHAARVRAWDAAGTEGGGDYTVGARLSRDDAGVFYVEHVIRGQWSAGQVDAIVKQTAGTDTTACRIREEQEPGSSGKAVIAARTLALAGYDYTGQPASGEKSTRWRPFAIQAEAGNVRIVRGDWNEKFLDELTSVPAAAHDDQADAASLAFATLALQHRGGGTLKLRGTH